MSRMKLVVLSMTAVIGLSANAQAKGWHICNHTPENLDVAVAYKDTQEKWTSKGWHSLAACGGCAFVMDHTRTEYVGVYYHAQNSAGEDRISGNTRFCVSAGAFTHTSSSSGEHCTTKGFHEVNIDTEGDYTSHIRGSLPGRQCTD